MNEFRAPSLEVTRLVEEAGGDDLRLCYQCGTCSASCPHHRVSGFRVRELVRLGQLGLEGYESDALWRCSTCKLCVDRCPREVPIINLIKAVRGLMHDSGSLPRSVSAMLGSVSSQGNPWSGEAAERWSWAAADDPPLLPDYRPGMDLLLFACCTLSYDRHGQRVLRSLARLLRAAGVGFGVWRDQRCCGESVAKVGHHELFESLRDHNRQGLLLAGTGRVVTTSPHCHQALSQDYGLDGVDVMHVLTLLRELLEEGRLRPTRPVPGVVAFHDPCYLGRHAGLYDDARAVLAAIPGLETREMAHHHEDSLCCGGGGGGMWLERKPEERLSRLRWGQAAAVGARTLATACPYCISMLEDGRLSLGLDEQHRVLDVIELLAQSVEPVGLENPEVSGLPDHPEDGPSGEDPPLGPRASSSLVDTRS